MVDEARRELQARLAVKNDEIKAWAENYDAFVIEERHKLNEASMKPRVRLEEENERLKAEVAHLKDEKAKLAAAKAITPAACSQWLNLDILNPVPVWDQLKAILPSVSPADAAQAADLFNTLVTQPMLQNYASLQSPSKIKALPQTQDITLLDLIRVLKNLGYLEKVSKQNGGAQRNRPHHRTSSQSRWRQ